jgi:hypothetical protein
VKKKTILFPIVLTALASSASVAARQNPPAQDAGTQRSASQNSKPQNAAAETAPKQSTPYKYPPPVNPSVPRAADGHPDLTGIWQGGSNRIGTWEDTNNGEGPLGQSGPITPFAVEGPQPKPPYQ